MSTQPDPATSAEGAPSNLFGFVPNLACALVFLISFSLLTIVHLGLTVKSRVWWMIVMVVGGVGEIVGWGAGRLWGHYNPTNLNPYLAQQVCLAISPAFFSAVCYALFTKLVFLIDPSLSRITAKYYTPIFVTADIVTLVVQAVGGGQSGAAAGADDPGAHDRAQRGGHIYLGGVAVQLCVMIAFGIVAVDYGMRVRKATKEGRETKGDDAGTGAVKGVDTALGWERVRSRKVKTLVGGVAVASGLIIFRNIFRTIELAEGYDGHLATHEVFIATLDSAPMVLCMLALVIAHPAFTLDDIQRQIRQSHQHSSEKFPLDSTSTV